MLKKSIRTSVQWGNAEINQFLKVANSEKDGLMYEFVILTGLRQGEVLALSWSDVDFENYTITISRNVNSIDNENEHIVKMRSGARTIELTPTLLAKLKKHREKQQFIKERLSDMYHHELDLVFPKKDGSVQNPRVVGVKLEHLIDKANLSQISFHDLRGLHASLLIEAGASPNFVKERLGYAEIDTIHYVYGPNSVTK